MKRSIADRMPACKFRLSRRPHLYIMPPMKNEPALWLEKFPRPLAEDHKYSRGMVTVLGGMDMTGATRLAAEAAARIGAGLVTILSPTFHYRKRSENVDPTLVYRAACPAHIIVRDNTSLLDFMKQTEPKARNVCVIGPGLGPDEPQMTRTLVLGILGRKTPVVLDADALNAFQANPKELLAALHENAVITPHQGEFARLFPNIGTKGADAALRAAREISATVVLKGNKTAIAQSEKDPVVNENAPPALATAGTGDALAGLIAGLIAQGMDGSDAACAAVWIHGRAATLFGPGLVAADLPGLIPGVLQELLGFDRQLG